MAELKNRDKLEAEFARKLARVFARHRRELVKLLGDPPDAANIPAKFWERVEKETNEETIVLLLMIFSTSMIQHGFVGDIADVSANAWATKRASDLSQQLTQTSRDWLRETSQRWNEPVPVTRPDGTKTTEAVPPTKAQVRDDTISIFGPKRVEGIAVTETTTAQHQGSETAVRDTVGLSDNDTWVTERDGSVCPVCRPLHGTHRGHWSRAFPLGPPEPHINCRCWIRYATPKAAS